MRWFGALFLAAFALAACAHSPGGAAVPAGPAAVKRPAVRDTPPPGKIKHIVFIVQENRTFDNIFGGPSPLPGADAATAGKMSDGSTRALTETNLENAFGYGDPNNYHFQWLAACNSPTQPPFVAGGPSPCRMNGFDLNAKQQKGYPKPPGLTYNTSLQYIYSYANRDEVAPYWFIAKNYAVSDRFFMGHNSESFTGHQYIFSSQSNNMVDSPVWPSSLSCTVYYDYCAYTPWGCDSPNGTLTYTLNSKSGKWNGGPPTPPDGPAPCFGQPGKPAYMSMADLAMKKGVSWRLYAYSMCSGIVGLDVNYTIRNSPAWPNKSKMSQCHANYGLYSPLEAGGPQFRAPMYWFLSDESGLRPLQNLTWILPGAFTSDHPGVPGGFCGPTWVSKVINAIGKNTDDWNSTIIFVLWDDWGGFYDHVPPYTVRDQAGPGFRVPLLVISPYVVKGHVDHTNIEVATLNKFVEQTFNMGSLGATDASPNLGNLNGFFNFKQAPQPFKRIPYPGGIGYEKCAYLTANGERPSKADVAKSRWLRIAGAGDPDGDGD